MNNKIMNTKTYASLLCILPIALAFQFATAVEEEDPFDPDAVYPDYGPYYTILIDNDVILDVSVTRKKEIFLQLDPEFKEEEIVVKISNYLKFEYLKWPDGEDQLVFPANQDKIEYEYTDKHKTDANYIEYYMDGELILHLTKVHPDDRE